MRHLTCLAMLVAMALPSTAAAQTAQDGRLIVTVLDSSGAVIPGASVTISALDDGARAATFAPVTTSDKGIASVDGLLPGRYRIRAEFPGFDIGGLPEVRVRRGDNKHVVVLPLKRMEESVTVAQNAQTAAADPRGSAFKTVLTKQEIENLSDDPTEMAQQLQDLAGGNATIRVDSFAGAPLPPKALIKSIHIVRDAFAAENHSAESEGIDIITQPGHGALSGGVNSRLRDGALSARNPFVAEKGPERLGSFEGNVGGTLIKGKSSFALSIEGRNGFDTPVANVVLPNGEHRSELLPLQHPFNNWSVYGLVDYALTRDQTLRLSYDQGSNTQENLGVGGSDLTERAYSTTSQDHELRTQVVGPLGRRMFANTRLQLEWQDSESVSAIDAQTIVVNGAFTRGGAQVSGGRHPRIFEAASDVDYVRGLHTVRTGFLAAGGNYRSDNATNRLGTYTFSSLDAFNAGTPATYTQRIGEPLVTYFNAQTAVYVQDDMRVRKSLTLSPGLRYEVQTHLNDHGNLGPRLGATWAPFKSGRTTLRGSYGIFYTWLNANTYEQTLRVDGLRQRDIFIIDPSYPDPGPGGTDHDGQPLLARSRGADGPHVASERRRRSDDQPESARERVVSECARGRPAPRTEPEHSGRRRPARSELRQHHPDRVGRRAALRSVVDDIERQSRRGRAERGRRTMEPAAHHVPSRLLDRAREQQLRRPLRRPAERDARQRVGPIARRPTAPLPDLAELAGGEEPERDGVVCRQYRHAVQHHDRLRQQRRLDLQRSARRAGAQQRPDLISGHRHREPAVLGGAGHADRRARAGTAGRRRRPRRPGGHGALPARDFSVGEQPDEPAELHRLQRHPDVAVFPDADVGDESTEVRPRRQPSVLACLGPVRK